MDKAITWRTVELCNLMKIEYLRLGIGKGRIAFNIQSKIQQLTLKLNQKDIYLYLYDLSTEWGKCF